MWTHTYTSFLISHQNILCGGEYCHRGILSEKSEFIATIICDTCIQRGIVMSWLFILTSVCKSNNLQEGEEIVWDSWILKEKLIEHFSEMM